ncbi:putative S-adenosylmethionine-dependent methyltransferase [subsurface metagenome]
MRKWSDSKFFGMASGHYQENQHRILSLLENDSNARVLDIGCADGGFTLGVGEAIGTERLYGMDIDEERVKRARERGIEAIVHDANTEFPYEDDSFDVVASNQVLEHLYNTDGFFQEVRRILKHRGYAVISTANLSSFHNLAFMNLGMMPPSLHVSRVQVGNFLYGTETHGHVKLFTAAALRDLSKYHGFEVERLVGSGIYPFPRRISNFLSKIFTRYYTYLTVKMRPAKARQR